LKETVSESISEPISALARLVRVEDSGRE
jgi:hypothetical protein